MPQMANVSGAPRASCPLPDPSETSPSASQDAGDDHLRPPVAYQRPLSPVSEASTTPSLEDRGNPFHHAIPQLHTHSDRFLPPIPAVDTPFELPLPPLDLPPESDTSYLSIKNTNLPRADEPVPRSVEETPTPPSINGFAFAGEGEAPATSPPLPSKASSDGGNGTNGSKNPSRILPPLQTNVPPQRVNSLYSPGGRPSKRKRRNIVLLLDGTGKEFCDKNSNLIKLHTVLKADEDQFLYYSSGLGTVLPSSTGSWAEIRRKAAMVIDLALAWNFDDFVCDAYAYLMDYYTPGDHVFIFGYSRGAYVARALAGMIQKVGLLPRGNHRSVKAAYRVYTDHRVVRGERPCTKTDSPGALYRRIFGLSRPVVIEFLGAWDTVSSLGGIGLPRLPFAGGVQAVKFFRQALALDERRIRFTPEYRYLDQRESQLCNNVTEAQETLAKARRTGDAAQIAAAEIAFARAVKAREEEYPTHSWTFDNGRLKRRRIDCWFMGSHSDVGGGSDFNGDPSLSNIPFRWILREAVDCGILLSSTGVRYLKAVAMPSGPPGGDGHGEIREYPSDATLRRLERLDNIVSDQLVNPQSEQDRRQELEELRSKIPQSELRKLVYLVAQRDVCAGPPSIDAMRPPKVSLKNIWWLLEYLPLKTRRYSPELVTVERSSKWIINRGRPRQMVGEQHVHVSVLWRMRAPVSDTLPLYRPTARLCKGFESWEATLDCPDDDMWER